MSAFKRRVAPTQVQVPAGCQRSQTTSSGLLTSTGIPSLDDVLGGGIPLGTSLIVLSPDAHSAHHELVHKYFIAQGIASGQQVSVIDESAKDIVCNSMWLSQSSASITPVNEKVDDVASKDSIKIAWRYESMKQFRTTVSSSSSEKDNFCAALDLTHRIPVSVVDDAIASNQLMLYDEQSYNIPGSVFAKLSHTVSTIEQPHRVSIPSYGGIPSDEFNPEILIKDMLQLRAILRRYPHTCALISFPAYMCLDSWGGPGWGDKLSWVSDSCITMESFASDPSMSSMFPSYHGFVHIQKAPSLHSLVSASDRFSTLRGISSASSTLGGTGENNLAFKVTRRRIVIETLHLDLEGGVGERRTTPAPSSFAAADSEVSSATHTITAAEKPAAVEVALDDPGLIVTPPTDSTPGDIPQAKKKPKKRVGFQSDRPEIYDF